MLTRETGLTDFAPTPIQIIAFLTNPIARLLKMRELLVELY